MFNVGHFCCRTLLGKQEIRNKKQEIDIKHTFLFLFLFFKKQETETVIEHVTVSCSKQRRNRGQETRNRKQGTETLPNGSLKYKFMHLNIILL